MLSNIKYVGDAWICPRCSKRRNVGMFLLYLFLNSMQTAMLLSTNIDVPAGEVLLDQKRSLWLDANYVTCRNEVPELPVVQLSCITTSFLFSIDNAFIFFESCAATI